ncbi:hypothetical protein GCM10010383_63240 [Streptomyces lomondensis]|uniref:Uncharacterized protein n=1 Tax=Streptomyces lomondensis TaxID=68229 RepID=A0ABQ2XMY3_9ACTN|nr:hypothetical protein GCM10010383_63240 [Streptomyces lomondensis]
MAQARELEGGACVPQGELLLDALEVREESPSRMRDLGATKLAGARSPRRKRQGNQARGGILPSLGSAPVRAFA